MARTRRCLGVDISNTHINIADVETTPSGVRVRKVASAPLPDFESGEFENAKKRQEAYVGLFKQLLKQEKLGGAAVFSVSGNYFFVRKLALPMASEERLEKIIQFESRQQIPLPPDKTVRQYQIFPKPEEKEAEVVLAAAKRENIQDFMKIVEWSGLKPRSLSVSSLALFNFFAFLHGKTNEEIKKDAAQKAAGENKKGGGGLGGLSLLKKKKKGADTAKAAEEEVNPAIGADTVTDPFLMDAAAEEGYEEVKAFLNLGTRTLDICIARISKKSRVLGFPRSVPLLGPAKEILKAIKKRFNLESEKDAQAFLDSKNFAALTFDFNAEAEADLDLEASEVVSEVFDAMVGEVRRSLDFYISQPDGMAVDSVVLCGPLARVRNIAPFFEEKLGLPTETMKLESDGADARVAGISGEQLSPYVIATGLALEGLNKGVITNVNFLPEDLKTIQEFKTKYVMLGAVAMFLACNIYIGAQLGQESIRIYEEETAALEQQMGVLAPLTKRTEEAIEARRAVAMKYEKLYKALPDERSKPLEILSQIQKQKPPNVFVKTFYLLPFGDLRIIGETEARDTAVQFVDNMDTNMKDYFDAKADKKNAPLLLRTTDITSKNFPGQRVTEFEIGMKIKNMRSVIQTPTPIPPQPGTQPGGMQPGFVNPAMMGGATGMGPLGDPSMSMPSERAGSFK